jgi:hypothetical protein
VQIFDNTNKPVKSTENEYNLKKNDVQDVKTLSCDCESHYTESLRSDQWNTSATFDDFTTTNINNNGLRLKVDQYNIVTGHSELKKTTEKIFNQANDALTTSTYYLYNPTSNLLSSETSSNSKGAIIESKTFYIEDYNLNNPANSVLNQMKNDHILNVPVSTEVWQTKAGSTTPEMIATSVTEFGIAPNGDYKPVKTYDLQADKPVSLSTIGNFDPDKLIRNPIGTPLIIPSAEINYDVNGNLTDTKDVQGKRNSSTLFGYNNVLPVATITNAASNEIAYTSFEQNDLTGNPFAWNWSNNPGSITDKNVPTGTRYSKGYIISDVISYKNKEYTLSFWANSNKFKVTPEILLTQKASSPTINGWTYYEYSIPPQNAYYTITLDGNGWGIDEVRLYPKNANMTTVTYDPYLGKTADCDINNRINYYEYDGMGRLIKILDENRNIIKTYEYHFKN